MNNMNEVQPNNDQWVLFLMINKNGGHQHAQLCKWNDDFSQYVEEESEDNEVFWIYAHGAGRSLLQAAIRAQRDTLQECENTEAEATDRMEELQAELNALELEYGYA